MRQVIRNDLHLLRSALHDRDLDCGERIEKKSYRFGPNCETMCGLERSVT